MRRSLIVSPASPRTRRSHLEGANRDCLVIGAVGVRKGERNKQPMGFNSSHAKMAKDDDYQDEED